MKKIYAINDNRDLDKPYITEPILLDNDVQASMAYLDFQKQLMTKHLIINDLRLFQIGKWNPDNFLEPLTILDKPREIPINLTNEEEGEENE